MNEIEDAVRRELSRAAEAARPPTYDARRLNRSVRIRRLGYVAGAALCAVAIVGLSVRVLDVVAAEPARAPAARQGPERETLFVLDYRPDPQSVGGAVHVVEVRDRTVEDVRTIDTGHDPDIAIAADGHTVYAVGFFGLDVGEAYSTLQVIDSRTGATIDEEPVDQWQGTSGAYIAPKIAAAVDGGLVYVLTGFANPEGAHDPPSAQIYDVASGEMLDSRLPLDGCPAPLLVPTHPREIAVVCRATNEIWFFEVGLSGEVIGPDVIGLPDDDRMGEDEHGTRFDISYISGAVYSARSDAVYTVTRAGDAAVVDATTEEVVDTATLPLPQETLVGVPLVEVSPDGNRLFVGVAGARLGSTVAEAIVTMNTRTWEQVGAAEVEPRWTLAITRSGNRLFGIDTTSGAVVGFDASVNRDLGAIGNVAGRPAAVYTAP